VRLFVSYSGFILPQGRSAVVQRKDAMRKDVVGGQERRSLDKRD
jgi:hypothetical protein